MYALVLLQQGMFLMEVLVLAGNVDFDIILSFKEMRVCSLTIGIILLSMALQVGFKIW